MSLKTSQKLLIEIISKRAFALIKYTAKLFCDEEYERNATNHMIEGITLAIESDTSYSLVVLHNSTDIDLIHDIMMFQEAMEREPFKILGMPRCAV